ncbi:phosphoribosylamine--glycine ligase [Candidatus Methylacidithermus pantelleriae]|uniref:Phosphoribosylamine--glycine ligase n=1 Tax=Candidatus Methylacidithermus pantelleriae TaxID=2744239 RepID=A0A8J2BP63_9BACT|nr:phosphoribosylamine--glycine ligase [Candidatus Methylacidithermus pantelleriae]CAF0695882.1 Phosphoribosylamine--glycine ligase [Candidatus Methylacidithermus pantelleriae]
MKVLLVGSGAREHALAWHLRRSGCVQSLYTAPGNAGTERLGTNLPIPSSDLEGLVQWAKAHRPDWVVVGPEAPLCLGLADRMTEEVGVPVLGPSKKAALLEGSKAATKELLLQEGIPTARGGFAESLPEAMRLSRKIGWPQVIKADGLAAGKGVFVVENQEQAEQVLESLLVERKLGEAGQRVVIEEFLVGEELSAFVFLYEHQMVFLGTARDYKRVGEGNRGPNTGGMGAYSPVGWATGEVIEILREKIFDPVHRALRKQGISYKGILYGGLLWNEKGPHVLEFNVRLGDPEAQVLVPLLPLSLLDLWRQAQDYELSSWSTLPSSNRVAVGVVVAARGYPEAPILGEPIEGLCPDVEVGEGKLLFLGGVRREADRGFLTCAGRVVTAVGVAQDQARARAQAYELAAQVRFPSAFFRRDIG